MLPLIVFVDMRISVTIGGLILMSTNTGSAMNKEINFAAISLIIKSTVCVLFQQLTNKTMIWKKPQKK